MAEKLVVDFFNHVNMLYGTISEFCTPTEVSYRFDPSVKQKLKSYSVR